jgi:transposase
VPGKRVTMRKAREVLRLHFEQQLRQRQIAASLNLSQSAVSDCLTRFRETGIPWPLDPPLDEVQLEAVLYPTLAASTETPAANNKTQPDFAAIQRQLQTNRHLTLEAVWAEDYAGGESKKQAYSYSWFCKLYERFKRIQNPVMRQEHIAGEKLFVDWAGDTLTIQNADGTTSTASIFIAAFGASSYTYIEATADQKLPAWIGAHIRAFEFFGGAPKLVIPDNTKSGVTVACRYDPVLQRTYEAMAEHYRIGVMPARKYKAKDKAIVENAVLVMQRFLARRFRNRSFLSWTELHAELRSVNEAINRRPMRKRVTGDTRASLFDELDKPMLQALPEERYDMSQWSIARVNIDYHVAFDFNFYSVPYTLSQKDVEIRASPHTVEIFHRSQRVASHIRILLPAAQIEHTQ